MIPWVREKFAESRLRWQNRKQQRNELIVPSPSISTVSENDDDDDDDSARSHVLPTNVRLFESIDEIPAPTTSAFLGHSQNGKRRLSTDHVPVNTNTNQLGRRDFSLIRHHTYSKLNSENDLKDHRRHGFVFRSSWITILSQFSHLCCVCVAYSLFVFQVRVAANRTGATH